MRAARMSPDLIATYIPCLWCGEVQVWYGNRTPRMFTAGQGCRCAERNAAMVAAGIERKRYGQTFAGGTDIPTSCRIEL